MNRDFPDGTSWIRGLAPFVLASSATEMRHPGAHLGL